MADASAVARPTAAPQTTAGVVHWLVAPTLLLAYLQQVVRCCAPIAHKRLLLLLLQGPLPN
jgi:hypothetical protein